MDIKMSTDGNITVNSGIGLPGLLTIVFLVLKLTGNIAWSWWWVFSPLWIPVAFGTGLFAVIVVVVIISAIVVSILDK
jgi:hypothetical protein